MKFDGVVKELGEANLGIPADEIMDLIREEARETWDTGPQRQKLFPVHTKTLSIVMRFTVSPEGVAYNQFPAWDTYYPYLKDVYDQAAKYLGYDKYDIARSMFAMLPAGADIPEHFDAAVTFDFCHRMHVPIKTNPDVDFRVDGQRIIMDKGQLYEINNRLRHGVKNKHPEEERIHLIFDLFGKG